MPNKVVSGARLALQRRSAGSSNWPMTLRRALPRATRKATFRMAATARQPPPPRIARGSGGRRGMREHESRNPAARAGARARARRRRRRRRGPRLKSQGAARDPARDPTRGRARGRRRARALGGSGLPAVDLRLHRMARLPQAAAADEGAAPATGADHASHLGVEDRGRGEELPSRPRAAAARGMRRSPLVGRPPAWSWPR